MAEGNEERSFLAKIDENFLICSICSETYRRAKCLPCLHTFCEQCLSELLKKDGKLDCPICRRTCVVPTGGVAMLQNNLFISDLVEQFRLQEDCKNELSTKCGWCEENEGDEVRCIECGMNLCSTCARPHRRVPATRSHRVMLLKEYKEAKSTDPASVSAPMHCKKHTSHPLAYFCVTCDEVICLECTVIDHKAPAHKHKYVTESAKIYVEELRELRTNLEGKQREVHESKQDKDNTITSLEKRYKEERGKLNVHIERIIQQVRDIGTQFAEEMKSEYESRKRTLQGQMKDLQCTEDDLSSTCEYIKNISDFGGAAHLMIAKKGITSQAQELMKTVRVPLTTSDYIEFRQSDDLVKIKTASVGEVLLNYWDSYKMQASKLFGSSLDLSIILNVRDHQRWPLVASKDEVRCTISGCGDSKVQMQVKSGMDGTLLLQSGNLKLERDCKLSVFLCGTQTNATRSPRGMSVKPLRFHHRHEGKVTFDNENKTAVIPDGNAIILSHRSVKCDEKISVKVQSLDLQEKPADEVWPFFSLTYGFTAECQDKDLFSSSLRKFRRSDDDDIWKMNLYKDNCTFRCWVSDDGQVLYTENDGKTSVHSRVVDFSKPLWFGIRLTGNKSVTINLL